MVGAAPANVAAQLRGYLVEHGDDLSFTHNFWRECELPPREVAQYTKFAAVIKSLSAGEKASQVSRELGINHNSVYNWKHLVQMPKAGHFLKALLTLGPPSEGRVWLTLEQSHGHAVPLGQFIQVPTVVRRWDDVASVLSQIRTLADDEKRFTRAYLFGFLIGILIGDAHKPRQGGGHRLISLVLSMKYETNLRIGEFTCSCAKEFGLRMERQKDIPKPEDKPHGFYVWTSQSSPIIDWMFLVVMGLAEGQHTTYDEVHMDWALEAPADFRRGLIQGIAESDGSVSVASQTVEFWVIPDWDFVIRLLATFGLRGFRNREAVSLVKSQAIDSFKVPVFAEHLQTVRYQKLQLMATTPKLLKGDRVPDQLKAEIHRLSSSGFSVPKIVEEIAKTHGTLLSFEAAQRWAMRRPGEGS